MKNIKQGSATLLISLMLAACGGGGSSGPVAGPTPAPTPAPADPFKPAPVPGTAPAQYTIKGIINVAETAEVDSDTNDVQASYKGNDSAATAQAINNPVLLVGHLTFQNQGPAGPNRTQGDLADFFKLGLTAGQVIELEFSSDPGVIDIDLFVRRANGTSAGPILGQSVGENRYECIRITTTGDYFVSAEIFQPTSQGDTVYQMRISAPGATATCANASAQNESNIIATQILAKPIAINSQLKSASTAPVSARLLSPEIADRIGPSLYEMPVLVSERAQALRSVKRLDLRTNSAATARSAATATSPAPTATDATDAVSYRSEQDASLDAESRAVLQTIAYAKVMKRSGKFEYAFPNFRVKTSQTTTPVGTFPPNDRDYSRQRWHYEVISLPAAMNTLQAMAAQPTRRPIVAVIDTGIVSNHPDLAGNIIPGYDFVSSTTTSGDGNGRDSNPDDAARANSNPSFHGSHVAGTVGAVAFNGIGGTGVAPMARLMPIRALGEGGSGNFSDIVQSILFAAGLPNDSGTVPPERADVINLSLGGQQSCPAELRDIFDRVRAQGSVVVAAAGNESEQTVFTPVGVPANCSGVISVAAVNATRGRAFYSNVGAENAIAAPGGDVTKSTTGTGDPDGIFSTVAGFQAGVRTPTYTHLMGTSMAAPHVAGVIALMRWVNPNLSVTQIDSLIRGGTISDDLGATGTDPQFGAGLINAKRAVDAAIASLGGGTTPPPPPVAGQIEPSPSSVSFGATRTEAELLLRRVGTTTDRVVSVASSLPSITVAPKPGAVDANGLGTYVLTLNRSTLTLGAAAFGQINVTTASRTFAVPLNADRRPAGAAIGSYGPVYITATDADDPNFTPVAGTFVVTPVNGEYAYTLQVGSTATPAPGKLLIFGGGDIDNDDRICNRGEPCGAYPTLGNTIEVIQPRSSVVDNINFSVTPYGGINPNAAAVSVRGNTGASGLGKFNTNPYVDSPGARALK
jgi:serine protease